MKNSWFLPILSWFLSILSCSFTHFELFLPIGMARKGGFEQNYPFQAVFTHFELFSPILTCFYPFWAFGMARKFQKFQWKCIFMDFSEITHFKLFLPILSCFYLLAWPDTKFLRVILISRNVQGRLSENSRSIQWN